jgi:glycogen debranching enzyme
MSVTLHEGTSFLISRESGDIVPGEGRGLFHQDARFLRRLEVLLDGQAPVLLTARVPKETEGMHFLANSRLDGAPMGTVVLVRRHLLGGGLHVDLDLENYGDSAAKLALSVGFETDFLHIFTVRKAVETGVIPEVPAAVRVAPDADGRSVVLQDEHEGDVRSTTLEFSERAELSSSAAVFRLDLPKRGTRHLCIDVSFRIGSSVVRPRYTCEKPGDPQREHQGHARKTELRERAAEIETDHPVLERAYRQAARDLVSLRLVGEDACGDATLAAGIPWFMALFGRDSLIASYQTLLHDPSLARGTLRLLARLQGTKLDEVASEEPGKILHEYRRGVDASARKLIPKFPYYGTIDATPLFLVTLSEYARCTGDLELVRELWDNVGRALEWLQKYGDRDGDGLLEYASSTGLANQGWKDSFDSVRFRDGAIATPPIALVEVQGYAFDALARCAELARLLGHSEQAEDLRRRAEGMRERILSRYWIEEAGFFAEALDGDKRQVESITSNPGHLLWSGVLPRDKAKRVARVLLSEEMFSGYGVRTMSEAAGGYNPISYHNGSIWPHDNSLIVAGFARYGLHDEAAAIVGGLLDALAEYSDDRLPELFAGYLANRFGTPIEYPTASRPQAWASGAVVSLVRSIFGLDVDAFAKRVALRPLAVRGLTRLQLSGIRLGGHAVRLELLGGKARITGLPDDWRVEA